MNGIDVSGLDWFIVAGFIATLFVLSTVIYYGLWRRGQAAARKTALELEERKFEGQTEFLTPSHPHAKKSELRIPKSDIPRSEEAKPSAKPPLELVEPVDLRRALAKTKSSFLDRLKSVFTGAQGLAGDELESLEEILYTSDLGPQTVQQLMASVNEKLPSAERSDFEAVRQALRTEMLDILNSVERTDELHLKSKPSVWMIVGVNGAGKTTTIGKLAAQLAQNGKKVLVAAGDTFRAAAGSQLRIWTERAQVEIFEPSEIKDPSAVAFDACQIAQTQGFDVVLIDTAGRLHTAKNLMEELKKMKRVIAKIIPEGPHEVLIVLDANSGQNALIQAREFNQAVEATGVVLTKLDGSAKGGVALGVACELHLPIRLIGVGEKVGDLRPFSPNEFIDSII